VDYWNGSFPSKIRFPQWSPNLPSPVSETNTKTCGAFWKENSS
jgi:hypothetical protein